MTSTPIGAPPAYPDCYIPHIGCCACLNLGRRSPATTLVARYALCNKHSAEVKAIAFDNIASIIKAFKNPSRSAT